MKKVIYSFLLFTICITTFAQDNHRGIIRVEKKGNINKIIFDNVNNRLIGKDSYGNILDSAVVSYDVLVTIKGIAYEEKVIGTTLSINIQNKIQRVDSGTQIFFSNIKVKEKNGTILNWPKFSSRIGFAYEKEE